MLSTTRQSPKTVELALDKAKGEGAMLTTLFILDSGMPESVFEKLTDIGFTGEKPSKQLQESILTEYRERGKRKVAEIERFAEERGVSFESIIKEGNFTSECLAAIEEKDADLVILTRRKRSNLSRFIFGSPLEEVKMEAGCEMLIVDE